MVYFILHLQSNESTFNYTFPERFLDKNYEIGLVKINGTLEVKNEIKHDENNNITEVNFIQTKSDQYKIEKTIDNIFLKCNLIEDSYINETKVNTIFRFEPDEDGEVSEEPRKIIYHKTIKPPKEIILKLVDKNNKTINFTNVDLWIEFNLKLSE
jgi:hypothetical protein